MGLIKIKAEIIGNFSKTKTVGILGTIGTVKSESYLNEIAHFFPEVKVLQQACPLWVPFIENKDYLGDGVDYFIQKDIEELFSQSPDIDTVLLACTHYPLLENKIRKFLPPNVTLVSQGEIVAQSLKDYLSRHPEINQSISQTGKRRFLTTDSVQDFEEHASIFFGGEVKAEFVDLGNCGSS